MRPFCACQTARRRAAGKAALTSLPPPPKQCAGFLSRIRVAKNGSNAASALHRRDVEVDRLPLAERSDELLAVHEALVRLEMENEAAARLVKLRYFVGFTIPEAAQVLDISPRKANQLWAYARAWLLTAIDDAS